MPRHAAPTRRHVAPRTKHVAPMRNTRHAWQRNKRQPGCVPNSNNSISRKRKGAETARTPDVASSTCGPDLKEGKRSCRLTRRVDEETLPSYLKGCTHATLRAHPAAAGDGGPRPCARPAHPHG